MCSHTYIVVGPAVADDVVMRSEKSMLSPGQERRRIRRAWQAGILTAGSVAIPSLSLSRSSVLLGLVGVAIFGTAFLDSVRRPRPRVADEFTTTFANAVRACADGGAAARTRLLDLLDDIQIGRTPSALRAKSVAFEVLTAEPDVLVALDRRARRSSSNGGLPTFALKTAAELLAAGSTEPITVALAALHPDGYVREAAVATMIADSHAYPGYVPLLVLRAMDWVDPVRAVAGAGLDVFLRDHAPTMVRPALVTALRLAHRNDGPAMLARVKAAIVAAPHDVRLLLFDDTDPRVRTVARDLAEPQWVAVWG
jgi:hypothetical protein